MKNLVLLLALTGFVADEKVVEVTIQEQNKIYNGNGSLCGDYTIYWEPCRCSLGGGYHYRVRSWRRTADTTPPIKNGEWYESYILPKKGEKRILVKTKVLPEISHTFYDKELEDLKIHPESKRRNKF